MADLTRWASLLAWGTTAALLLACAGARGGAAGAVAPLYVANAGDGTVAGLDRDTGRPLGPTVPAPGAPGQLVAGRSDTILVRGAPGRHGGELTLLTPTTDRGGRTPHWRARPVSLGEPAQDVTLAGDGHDHAVVAYQAFGESGQRHCRLALVDLRDGAVTRRHTVCAAGEEVGGVALAGGPASLVAYLALWRGATSATGVWTVSRSRVVALDATTGAVLAAQPLAGVPVHLTLGPAPGRLGARLYFVAAADAYSGPDADTSVRLLGLHPDTLEVQSAHLVASPLNRLVVAPDGEHAYGLTEAGTFLDEVDLVTGATARRAEFPRTGYAADLAVTDRWVYVANALGHEVWAVDRRRGGIARSIRVGQGPVAFARPERSGARLVASPVAR